MRCFVDPRSILSKKSIFLITSEQLLRMRATVRGGAAPSSGRRSLTMSKRESRKKDEHGAPVQCRARRGLLLQRGTRRHTPSSSCSSRPQPHTSSLCLLSECVLCQMAATPGPPVWSSPRSLSLWLPCSLTKVRWLQSY